MLLSPVSFSQPVPPWVDEFLAFADRVRPVFGRTMMAECWVDFVLVKQHPARPDTAEQRAIFCYLQNQPNYVPPLALQMAYCEPFSAWPDFQSLRSGHYAGFTGAILKQAIDADAPTGEIVDFDAGLTENEEETKFIERAKTVAGTGWYVKVSDIDLLKRRAAAFFGSRRTCLQLLLLTSSPGLLGKSDAALALLVLIFVAMRAFALPEAQVELWASIVLPVCWALLAFGIAVLIRQWIALRRTGCVCCDRLDNSQICVLTFPHVRAGGGIEDRCYEFPLFISLFLRLAREKDGLGPSNLFGAMAAGLRTAGKTIATGAIAAPPLDHVPLTIESVRCLDTKVSAVGGNYECMYIPDQDRGLRRRRLVLVRCTSLFVALAKIARSYHPWCALRLLWPACLLLLGLATTDWIGYLWVSSTEDAFVIEKVREPKARLESRGGNDLMVSFTTMTPASYSLALRHSDSWKDTPVYACAAWPANDAGVRHISIDLEPRPKPTGNWDDGELHVMFTRRFFWREYPRVWRRTSLPDLIAQYSFN